MKRGHWTSQPWKFLAGNTSWLVDGPLPRVMPGGYPRGVAQKNRITIYQSTANQLAINYLDFNKYLPSNLEFLQCQSFNINYPRTRSFYNDFGFPQLFVLVELPPGKKLVQNEIRPSEIGVMFTNLAKKQFNHPIISHPRAILRPAQGCNIADFCRDAFGKTAGKLRMSKMGSPKDWFLSWEATPSSIFMGIEYVFWMEIYV